MSFTPERIDHVEVYVRDLEAAARWYREVLGLEEVARWDPEPVMVGTGGSMLALFRTRPAPDPASPDRHWIRVAWRTDEAGFAAAQEHLRALGIPFRGPIDHGRAWSVYFADPDGNPLEITTYR